MSHLGGTDASIHSCEPRRNAEIKMMSEVTSQRRSHWHNFHIHAPLVQGESFMGAIQNEEGSTCWEQRENSWDDTHTNNTEPIPIRLRIKVPLPFPWRLSSGKCNKSIRITSIVIKMAKRPNWGATKYRKLTAVGCVENYDKQQHSIHWAVIFTCLLVCTATQCTQKQQGHTQFK